MKSPATQRREMRQMSDPHHPDRYTMFNGVRMTNREADALSASWRRAAASGELRVVEEAPRRRRPWWDDFALGVLGGVVVVVLAFVGAVTLVVLAVGQFVHHP